MRRAVLALVILSAPSLAVADDVRRTACRLTSAECAVVLHEVAVDADLFAQDQKIVGVGLSPQDRATALIRRDDDRMAARLRQLPGPVAAEIARVQTCQALGGATKAGSTCR